MSIFHGGHCKRHQTNYSRRLCSTSLLPKCLENHKLYGLSRQEEHTHQLSWLRTQLVWGKWPNSATKGSLKQKVRGKPSFPLIKRVWGKVCSLYKVEVKKGPAQNSFYRKGSHMLLVNGYIHKPVLIWDHKLFILFAFGIASSWCLLFLAFFFWYMLEVLPKLKFELHIYHSLILCVLDAIYYGPIF